MGKRGGKPAPRAVASKPALRVVAEKPTLPEECGNGPAAMAAGNDYRSPISVIAAEAPRWVDVAVCEAAETSEGGSAGVVQGSVGSSQGSMGADQQAVATLRDAQQVAAEPGYDHAAIREAIAVAEECEEAQFMNQTAIQLCSNVTQGMIEMLDYLAPDDDVYNAASSLMCVVADSTEVQQAATGLFEAVLQELMKECDVISALEETCEVRAWIKLRGLKTQLAAQVVTSEAARIAARNNAEQVVTTNCEQPEQKQPAGEQQQPIGEQQQPIGEQQQPIGEQQQPVGEQQQSLGEQQQPVGEQQQSLGEQQQSLGEQQQPLGKQQQPVGEQQQPVGEQQQQVSSSSQ